VNDSSFEAMADEIEGLLGIDATRGAGRAVDTLVVRKVSEVCCGASDLREKNS
jgi:hypothetical protein